MHLNKVGAGREVKEREVERRKQSNGGNGKRTDRIGLYEQQSACNPHGDKIAWHTRACVDVWRRNVRLEKKKKKSPRIPLRIMSKLLTTVAAHLDQREGAVRWQPKRVLWDVEELRVPLFPGPEQVVKHLAEDL